MNPIAVIAFNRPDYLIPTLASLACQQEVQIGPIALFQDGMYNQSSGKSYGEDRVVEEQIAFFRYLFPQGVVFRAKHNMGPALMFQKAEEWMFERLGADVGYFFEDDLILAPYYLKTLENIVAATDDRVGYCACYGPLWNCPDAPANSWVPMHMNWGFALRRSQWLKSKPYVDAYLDLLKDVDYRDRPMGKIMKLREEWGAPGPYTTQDVMRTIACLLTGGIKLNTRAALGRYIGARGLHIDPQTYEAAGFAKVEPFPYLLRDFPPLDDKIIAWCLEVHNRFTGIETAVAESK